MDKRVRILLLVGCSLLILLMGCTKETVVSEHHVARKTNLDTKKQVKRKPPKEVKPLDVPLLNQMDDPRLYNGCEVTSLAMIANYEGYKVTKNELANQLPTVPLDYENGLKGNPNKGFVGDMVDGPGLTVYHEPIYQLAKEHVSDKAEDVTGVSTDEIYNYLAKGFPVWVIITVDYQPTKQIETWNTPEGKVKTTPRVHSAVVTGYDEKHIYVNDPYGEKNKKVAKDSFMKAWKQLGRQAIIIKK
ncbi:MAG TPA: C39 family peptidase [Candidatus Avamphibacillus intestinigallinarum]|nr:C39 family peptidase [Candidatus Avamphibacillus intestinigallinarum]